MLISKFLVVRLKWFHYLNLKDSFDITPDELRKNHAIRVISTSCTQVIEEALQVGQHQNAEGKGRLILHLV